MLQASTLRPGLLVSLKTSCHGNVKYETVDLEHGVEDGTERSKWETTRTVADLAEFEAAKKARGKASSLIRGVCSASAFGLLCPEDDADLLEEAIADARKVVAEFNATAALTRVEVYVIAGRIAQDDVEAVRAINSEIRGLIDDMTAGVRKMDAQAIRDAATKARQLGSMLTADAEAKVKTAIDTARSVARQIVKAGEAASVEVDELAIRKITEQRTAFLDLSDAVEVERPQAQGRAIDLSPAELS